MNSGKSSLLIQSAFNYKERDMNTMIFIPKVMNTKYIKSRIGLLKEATVFDEKFDFYEFVKENLKKEIRCLLIDETQFLKKLQVKSLCRVVDKISIPVLCYGLRTDFLGELFEGSQYLLALADKLVELKSMCYCGKKAIMNMRKANDKDKIEPVREGKQIEIGGNDRYVALCRKCYTKIYDQE